MRLTVKSFDDLSNREIYEILAARADIFTVERGMTCLDPDGRDLTCLHAILRDDDGTLCAYLRAQSIDGRLKIGRVLTLTHGVGHGRALLETAIPELIRITGLDETVVHSQLSARGFYEALDFTAVSDIYDEAGVPHITMVRGRDI